MRRQVNEKQPPKKPTHRNDPKRLIYNMPIAFSWGQALLNWHPVEQERYLLAREILNQKIKI